MRHLVNKSNSGKEVNRTILNFKNKFNETTPKKYSKMFSGKMARMNSLVSIKSDNTRHSLFNSALNMRTSVTSCELKLQNKNSTLAESSSQMFQN